MTPACQIRDIEAVSRMLHALMLEAVGELDSCNLAATTGFGSTKRLLAGMLQLSATEAGTRVTHATQLVRRRTLSGEVLPPVLPNTAAALAAGQIGPGQVRVIVETMAPIPASVSVEQRQTAEADLARYAHSFNPTSLHKIGRHLLAHLDQDGPQPREEPEVAASAARRWACDAKIIPVVLCAGHPNHWTSGGRCGPSHWPCATHSWPGTADAHSLVATGHRDSARPITADTGPTVGTPAWRTVSSCARPITGTCTTPAGRSLSTLTTSTSSPQRSSTRPVRHFITLCAAKRSPPSN